MSGFKERVQTEKAQLDERIQKLNTFIESNPQFPKLSAAEQQRLKEQRTHMVLYSRVLLQRLAADFQ